MVSNTNINVSILVGLDYKTNRYRKTCKDNFSRQLRREKKKKKKKKNGGKLKTKIKKKYTNIESFLTFNALVH